MVESRPTVRRRRLAAVLVQLREEAGKTPDEAAERIGCHRSKISRIENARLGISLGELRDLLMFYGVEDQKYVETMANLARRGSEPGWTRHLGATLPSYADHIDYEQTADYIRSWQPFLIAGLFQTPDYARALYRANPEMFSKKQVDEFVDTRMQRQEVLERGTPPRIVVIEGEAALRSQVGGPKIMGPQLDQLLELSDRSNVEIQVLPLNAGAHVGMTGAFVVFGFPTPAFSDVVCVEHVTGTLHMETPEETRSYTLAFDSLRSAALSPVDSLDLIQQVRREL
ncbi:helix-turn-helix domain-containing protein [Streptomyces fulvoviolaceus]|uniref:helix-turn-helix domain-containing protein n=1 Tax=Streptomyces fulvoviolaceus TaxID=285535 RepID=UPI0021C1A2FB|nr:helix-turn-helix transcriptional regulator [Streptomyces fulvoviolaceus]MCT9084455.1 helix-turn-helix transcriptional regulator [Streptomyces fulvoviolaceus]